MVTHNTWLMRWPSVLYLMMHEGNIILDLQGNSVPDDRGNADRQFQTTQWQELINDRLLLSQVLFPGANPRL